MNTEYWASIDQLTSFAKEPWGFNRPNNRTEHSTLSKATFATWPNTTSDFSLRRSVNRSDFKPVRPQVAPVAPSSKAGTTAKRRQTKLGTVVHGRDVHITRNTAGLSGGARNSADCVTSAYTLASVREVARGNVSDSPQSRTTLKQHERERARLPLTSSWSASSIGYSDVKGEMQTRRERERREGFKKAAFAANVADKPYIGEGTHFRYKYPHTLGRIKALSRSRSNRSMAFRKGEEE